MNNISKPITNVQESIDNASKEKIIEYGISFAKNKCFKKNPNKIFPMNNVNLFIGKNNTGKSTIINVLNDFFRTKDNTRSGNNLINSRHCNIIATVTDGELINNAYVSISGEYIENKEKKHIRTNINSLKNLHENFSKNNVIYLGDVKDFKDELTQNNNITNILSNGGNASRIIYKYLNIDGMDEELIEVDLVEKFNKIFEPDINLKKILSKSNGNSIKTRIVENSIKEKIEITESGLGVRIVLILLLMLVVESKNKTNKGLKPILLLEEMENGLHPALQRKVFNFIYDWAIENDALVFLTTHSHIPINIYSKRENAQIFHTTKENGESEITPVSHYLEHSKILDDLDVRASDLLQSNGIIWVEGPSDRIYLNKWIEIYSEGKLKEEEHYQILHYGGSLLAHNGVNPNLTSEEVEELNKNINLLKTNRNSAILMDSDKVEDDDELKARVKRVNSEFEKVELFSWITQGKEVENYLSKDLVNKEYEVDKELGQYDKFDKYIGSKLKSFNNQKNNFSKKMVQHMTKENLSNNLDLEEKMNDLITVIKKWNKL
jgi:predicted ATP-dependent endonuclease of OLD family